MIIFAKNIDCRFYITWLHNRNIWLKDIFCLLVVRLYRFLWNFEGLIWLSGCCYQIPDLSHIIGSVRVRRRLINTHCNGESNACISVFWLWSQRRIFPGQKGGSVLVLYNWDISQKQIARLFRCNQSTVSRTTRRYQQSRFHEEHTPAVGICAAKGSSSWVLPCI